MILGLAIALCVTLLTAWLTIMFIWWRTAHGLKLSPLRLEHIEHELERGARLARRGWYASTLYGAKALDWGTNRALGVFFRVFPKAREAFVKHDELVGLNHGPTSYFLMSISEKPKKVAQKKIVS